LVAQWAAGRIELVAQFRLPAGNGMERSSVIKPLELAIARIQQLPEEEQEMLARFVLHELDVDSDWRHSSEAHGDALARLTADILAEDARGECPELDVEEL
jgi:hypothetical protein